MPAMVMSHDVDPREALVKSLGDLKDVDVFNAQILVAVYQRSKTTKKTIGGIIIPDTNLDEDRFQSKVGIIVKMGDAAFDDPNGVWFKGIRFHLGDWVVYRVSDGFPLTINGVLCRLMDDTSIRARIQHPDTVW